MKTMGIFTNGTGSKKQIWISEHTYNLIKTTQESAQKKGIELTQDEVISLSLDKPAVVIIDKGENKRKRRFESIFDSEIGRLGGV